jgi:hypothetical protein
MSFKKFLTTNKYFFIFLSILALSAYSYVVFAAPSLGSGGYAPGAELDPDCQPGDTGYDCKVQGGWLLGGNSGTTAGTNFIGTTDSQALVFKTNNTEAVRILANGNVGIGTNAPATKLDLQGDLTNVFTHGDGTQTLMGNNDNFFGGGEQMAGFISVDPTDGYFYGSTNADLQLGGGNATQSFLLDFSTQKTVTMRNEWNAGDPRAVLFANDGIASTGSLITLPTSGVVAISSSTTGGINTGLTLDGTGFHYNYDGTFFTLPTVDGSNGQVLQTDGAGNFSWTASSTTNPGGSNTQIQFNNSGTFGGDSNFTWDNTAKSFNVTGSIASNNVDFAVEPGSFSVNSSTASTYNSFDLKNDGTFNLYSSISPSINSQLYNNINGSLGLRSNFTSGESAYFTTDSTYGTSAGWSGGSGAQSYFQAGNEYNGSVLEDNTFKFGQSAIFNLGGNPASSAWVLTMENKSLPWQAAFSAFPTHADHVIWDKDVNGGAGADILGFYANIDSVNGYTGADIFAFTDYSTYPNNVLVNRLVVSNSQTDGVWMGYNMDQGTGGTVQNSATASVFRMNGDFTWSKPNSIGTIMTLTGTTGNLGIGKVAATDKLEVNGDIRVGTSSTNGCLKDFSGGTITGTCSSDERLKTNVAPVTDILEKLTSINLVTYEWNDVAQARGFAGNVPQLGVLAQNVEAVFPDLVITDKDGFKQVNYTRLGMMNLEAIKELNIKIKSVEDFANAENKTFLQNLVAWLGNKTNGITDLFAGTLHAKDQICIDDVCVTKADLQQMIQNKGSVIVPQVPAPQTPAPEQGSDPVVDPVPEVAPEPTPEVANEPIADPVPEVAPVPESQPSETL